MGDLAAAKRNMMWVKDAVSSARWDNYESSLNKVEQALDGVPDGEKAEVVAELAALKQEAESAQKAEKAKRVTRDLDRRIDAIDPRSLVTSALVTKLEEVLTRLTVPEVTSVVEPAVIESYRAKVQAMMPAAEKPAEKPAPAPAPSVASPPRPAEKAAPAPVVSAPIPARPAPAPAPAAAVPSVDLGPAKRELMWLKDAVSSRNWLGAEERAEKLEGLLAPIPEADKAGLVSELLEARKEAQAGQKKEKATRLVDEIERKISGADPRYNAPDAVASMLKQATERLDSEEARRFIDPEVISQLRARIASVGGASAAGEKSRLLERAESLLARFDEEYGSGPFVDRDEMEARRAYQTLASHLTGARNNHQDLAPSDADAQRVGARIDASQKKLDAAWAAWEQARETGAQLSGWERTQEDFAGWEAEGEGPSWEEFNSHHEHVTQLNMPTTRWAITHCLSWLGSAKPVLAKYPENAALAKAVKEAQRIVAAATEKLHRAFEKLMAEAEGAALPTEKQELEKPQKVVQYVGSWFEKTPHLEASQARAHKLQSRWTEHVDELDRLGAELYDRLEAEAEAKWPAILAKIPVEPGFDPNDLAKWKGKTVLIAGVWNRSGWDFAGDFHFENRIGGIPVAGDWDARIGAALRDAVQRTRKSINDHKEWDLVGIVKGTGEVKRRTQRELVVKGTNEKIKTETWDPEPCVVIQIIAMRAGPVAIGPA